MPKFTIVSGKPLEASFILKATGTLLPVTLDATDTATFTLSTIGRVPTKVLEKALTLGVLVNGEFLLSLTNVETAGLEYKVGWIEDGGRFMPTYRATVSANTLQEGHVEVQIPEVVVVFEG